MYVVSSSEGSLKWPIPVRQAQRPRTPLQAFSAMVEPARRQRLPQPVPYRSARPAQSGGDNGDSLPNFPRPTPGEDDRPNSHAALFRLRVRGHARRVRVAFVADRLSVPSMRNSPSSSVANGRPTRARRMSLDPLRYPSMGTKKATSGGAKKTSGAAKKSAAVLPSMPKSGRTIVRAGDLLSDSQRRTLRHDLDQLARIRRDAEASSSTLRLS